jgi:hypothetical protein
MMMLIWVFVIAIAYGVVVHEQVATEPWLGKPDPIWATASAALGVHLQGSVSVIKLRPLFALGNTVACLLSVSLGLIVGENRQDARRLLWVVACSGACYAAYGIFSALVTPNELLWLERPGYVGDVTGTFVNRNTAATYFGCVSVIWLLLLLEAVKSRLPRGSASLTRLVRHLSRRPSRLEIGMFLSLVLSLMALLMTGSRAGVVFSLIAMIAAGSITLRSALPKTYGARWLWIGGSILALLLFQVFGGVIQRRFETSGISDEGRFEAYTWMLRAILDRPVFGAGLGTFETIFPSYRQEPPSMQGVWTLGHCTPLEMAVELGVPLTAIVVISVFAGLVTLGRGAFMRRRDAVIPLAGAAVLGISAVHSCIDFSLQIPGLAIVSMIVTGVGLSQSVSSRWNNRVVSTGLGARGMTVEAPDEKLEGWPRN